MRKTRRLGLALGGVAACAAVLAQGVWAAPTLTVTPAVLAPTQTMTVGGSGFAANEGVDVFLDATDLALTGTDGTGAMYSTPVALPASATPGNHWVSVIGRRDGLYAQKLITVHTGWVERGWSAFGRSLNPFENVLNPSNVGGLEEDWSAPSAGVVFSGAAVGSGARQVVFVDILGVVRAVSEVTGAPAWSRTLAPTVRSVPAIDSGRVYVAAGDGNVYGLNATTGGVVWQTAIGVDGDASPAVAGNVVYIGSANGNVYALNGTTGALVWKGATGSLSSSPAVSGGRVFVGGGTQRFAFAVGCASGGGTCTPLWSTSTGNLSSAPAVSNGVVYVGSGTTLYAQNAANGRILWTGALPGGVDTNAPAVANGVVYMTVWNSGQGVLSAFPQACGSGGGSCSPLWQTAAYDAMEGTPAVVDGVVYVGSGSGDGQNGSVMAFPASTACATPCRPLWTATQPGADWTSPIVSDGTLIAGWTNYNGNSGGITAWDLSAVGHAPVLRPDPRTLKPDLSLQRIRP